MTIAMINMALEDARLSDLEFITIELTADFIDAYFQMYTGILVF